MSFEQALPPPAPTPTPTPTPSVPPPPVPLPPLRALFPDALKGPLCALLAVTLPGVLMTVFNALTFWVIWDEMKPESIAPLRTVPFITPHLCAIILLVLGLAPALLAAGFAAMAKVRKTPLHFAAQTLTGLAGVGYLFVFFWLISDAIPASTPRWIVGGSFFLWQLAAMTPGIFLALWRLSALPLPFSVVKDFVVSIVVTFGVPAALYLTCVLVDFISTKFGSYGSPIFSLFVFTVFVGGTIVFFLGLLRLLMLLWREVSTKGENSAALRGVYIFVVAFALPIGGLVLNSSLPFPADYQNPWPYALVVVNTFALLAPIFLRGKKKERGFAASTFNILASVALVLRWALFPFTLYFFIVFLPFLPFSILAITFAGAGFLVLAPTLLFILHVQALRQDVAEWKNTRPKGASLAFPFSLPFPLAALAIAVLPLGFVANAEYDRYALHAVLDYHASRDFSVDAPAPFSPKKAERVLRNAEDFKDGAQIPYLDNWYNWRVFDNLMLPDKKFDDLWNAFVGGDGFDKKEHLWRTNIFSELFNSRTSESRSLRGWGFRLSRNTELSGTTVVVQKISELETEARVRLQIRVNKDADDNPQEYDVFIAPPPGVWVSGLKLKIYDKWEDGKIVERKAAEWIYRRITEASRDPAFLRYQPDGSLRLSVFPVSVRTPREVEISFLFPTGLADSVKIGEKIVRFDGAASVKPMLASAGGVVASNGAGVALGAGAGAGGIAARELRDETCLIVDCSEGQNWTPQTLRKALERLVSQKLPHVGSVVFANYETLTLALPDGENGAQTIDVDGLSKTLAAHLLPERGGFDVNAALRRASRRYALAFNNADSAAWRAPVFVVLSNRDAAAKEPEPEPSSDRRSSNTPQLANVIGASLPANSPLVPRPETLAALRNELPMLGAITVVFNEKLTKVSVGGGAVNAQAKAGFIPLRVGNETRWLPVGGAGLCVFTGDAGGSSGVGIGGLGGIGGITPLSVAEVRLPVGSRWAQGAAAWRLQRRYEEAPAAGDLRRDILRASRESGVMTSAGAYIVVENSAQWKTLDLKQQQALGGSANLDLNESEHPAPAPGFWALLLCAVFCFVARKLWQRTGRAR